MRITLTIEFQKFAIYNRKSIRDGNLYKNLRNRNIINWQHIGGNYYGCKICQDQSSVQWFRSFCFSLFKHQFTNITTKCVVCAVQCSVTRSIDILIDERQKLNTSNPICCVAINATELQKKLHIRGKFVLTITAVEFWVLK